MAPSSRRFRGLKILVVLGIAFALLIFLWGQQIDRLNEPLVLHLPKVAEAAPAPPDFKSRKVIRVLAISGGGVRGIIPISALIYLEQKTGRPVAELFDLVVGTSSGGIITAACLYPGEDGRPRFTAQEVLEAFQEVSPKIFSPPLARTMLSVDGLLAPKYSSPVKHAALRGEFGDLAFDKLLKPAVLTALDLAVAEPVMMSTWKAPWVGCKATDLVGVSTSFPGVFNPVFLQGPDTTHSLIDLGLVENDPALAAWQMVRKEAPEAKVVLVDLGTGRYLPSPNVAGLMQ